jgi:hypothetical protein
MNFPEAESIQKSLNIRLKAMRYHTLARTAPPVRSIFSIIRTRPLLPPETNQGARVPGGSDLQSSSHN